MGERGQEQARYAVFYAPNLSFFILILFNLSKDERRECNGATKRTFFPYYAFSLCFFHYLFIK